MNIVDVASKYFKVKKNSHNSWIIEGSEYDSVVLYPETDTYHRFSNGETGNIYKFLKNIVKLHPSECAQYSSQQSAEISLTDRLRKSLSTDKTEEQRAGYDYYEFIGKRGYNQYIASRNISEETANYYQLEVSGADVLFPLYNENLHRIGSIRRSAYAQNKSDRYRTLILHGYDKPCVWDFREVAKLTPDKIVVLVEGTWSAMRIKQVVGELYPVVPLATMGANIQSKLFNYIYENRIIAILDDDKGGEQYKKQLQVARAKRIMVEEVTLNYKGKLIYIDDISDEQMLKLFSRII